LRRPAATADDGPVFVGINAGFGAPLGPSRAFIESVGFTLVRQEFRAGLSDRAMSALLGEFTGRRLTLLALLGGGRNVTGRGGRLEPHVFAALGARVIRAAADVGVPYLLVEVGNEPDIGHHDYAQRPQDFAAAVSQTYAAMRQAGFGGPVISGGVSNLSRERLDYLEQVVAAGLPPDVVLGFHRYPHGMTPAQPHPGFDDRDAEWSRLMAIAGQRRVACTEFGHHTARRRHLRLGLLRPRRRLPEATVAEHIVYDYEFFRERACLLAALYQLNDGPSDRPVDRYGIRRADGTPKAAVEAIAAFVAGTPSPAPAAGHASARAGAGG
jgi:hypothetical protein